MLIALYFPLLQSKQAEAMKKLGLPEGWFEFNIQAHDCIACIIIMHYALIIFLPGLGSDFGSTSNIAQFEVPSSQSEPVAATPPPTVKRRRHRPSSAESPAKLLLQLRSPNRKVSNSLMTKNLYITCSLIESRV